VAQYPRSCGRHSPQHRSQQGLLGAILINNEVYNVVSELIKPQDLFEPIHQRIYALAGELIASGKLASPITLKNHLPIDLDIAGMSLNQYLARLCAEATTVINAPDYAKTVSDLAHRRTVITIAAEMQAVAADSPIDFSPDMLAQQTIERPDEIVMARTETHIPRVSIGNAARQAVDQMSAVLARGVWPLRHHDLESCRTPQMWQIRRRICHICGMPSRSSAPIHSAIGRPPSSYSKMVGGAVIHAR
jgi:hypothetical protein